MPEFFHRQPEAMQQNLRPNIGLTGESNARSNRVSALGDHLVELLRHPARRMDHHPVRIGVAVSLTALRRRLAAWIDPDSYKRRADSVVTSRRPTTVIEVAAAASAHVPPVFS